MSDNLDSSAETLDQQTPDNAEALDKTLLDNESESQKLNGDTWYTDDWRDKLSGGDEKIRGRLDRFTDPTQILNSWLAAEQKIHSGEFKQVMPKDATEEQLKVWRAENGVPDSPDKYELKFESGLVIGEEDKTEVDKFLKVAHENNMPTQFVTPVVEWYFNARAEQEAEFIDNDKQKFQQAEDELRAKWGNDYRGNINAVKSFVADAPETIRDQVLRARLPDGTLLGVNPDAMQWMANKERTLNPAATIVPAGTNQAEAVATELKAIRDRMKTDMDGYRKDTDMQKRFEELLEYEVKLKK